MAQYYPPTEDVPIFDTNLFEDPNEFLTVTKANGKYLRFPNAQGDENLQGITVSGTSIFNQLSTFNDGFTVNGTGSDCTFNNFYSNFHGDVNLMSSSLVCKNDTGYCMQINAADDGNANKAYIQNYGEVGMIGNYVHLTSSNTTGRVSFRSNVIDLTGTDDMALYSDTNTLNGTITTKTGILDFIEPLKTAPTVTNPIVRICANKLGAVTGDTLGQLQMCGYDPTSTIPASGGGIALFPAANWSSSNHSSYMQFLTCPTSSLISRSAMILNSQGFLRIGASTATASYPLHITTVNGANSTLLIDAGSSTANSPVLSLHNNEATSATTRQILELCMAKNAGNFALNSLAGDGVLRVGNTTGTTTNRLLLSANSAINAPFIDVGNRMHMGTDTTGASLLNIKGTFPQFKITSGDFANPASINMVSPSGFTSNMTLNDTALFINSSTGFVYCSGSSLGASPSNTYDCGLASLYWKNVRSAAYPAVSDGRLKKDIKPSNLGLGFINKLNPVSFKFISSPDVLEGNVIVDNGGVREHYGLITQDVKKVLDEEGVNGAMWSLADVKDPESRQFLCYNELISPMIKAIQDLTLLVKDLRTEINELKAGR
jgi:hypothetical protein